MQQCNVLLQNFVAYAFYSSIGILNMFHNIERALYLSKRYAFVEIILCQK